MSAFPASFTRGAVGFGGVFSTPLVLSEITDLLLAVFALPFPFLSEVLVAIFLSPRPRPHPRPHPRPCTVPQVTFLEAEIISTESESDRYNDLMGDLFSRLGVSTTSSSLSAAKGLLRLCDIPISGDEGSGVASVFWSSASLCDDDCR
jgi:hypothetical protein